jgi:4-hydroxy-4-methyl-2-oxoglutarate aldolase
VTVPEIQVPLLIGGIEVLPGDLLVGDDDGIIVGTVADFEAIVDAAEAIQTREKKLRISIENGFSLFDTRSTSPSTRSGSSPALIAS